jgi:hypothetical protein
MSALKAILVTPAESSTSGPVPYISTISPVIAETLIFSSLIPKDISVFFIKECVLNSSNAVSGF